MSMIAPLWPLTEELSGFTIVLERVYVVLHLELIVNFHPIYFRTVLLE